MYRPGLRPCLTVMATPSRRHTAWPAGLGLEPQARHALEHPAGIRGYLQHPFAIEVAGVGERHVDTDHSASSVVAGARSASLPVPHCRAAAKGLPAPGSADEGAHGVIMWLRAYLRIQRPGQ